MRINKLALLITLAAFASWCANKENKTADYWTEKSGVPLVHHVVGNVDSIEKLSETPLTKDEVSAYHLPKGKYFKVVAHVEAPAKPAKTPPKAKTDANAAKDKSKEKLATVTQELSNLERHISNVEAENKHLQEQIDNAAKSPEPTPTPDPEAPRPSQ
jgi:hypothetical protein